MGKEDKTTEQLRTEIDRGQGGSKVPWSDPAAVPLGADEEAAGTPPPARAVGIVFDQEARSSFAHRAQRGAGGSAVNPPSRRPLVVLSVVLIAAVIGALWFAFQAP